MFFMLCNVMWEPLLSLGIVSIIFICIVEPSSAISLSDLRYYALSLIERERQFEDVLSSVMLVFGCGVGLSEVSNVYCLS